MKITSNILICGLVRNEEKLREKLGIFCQLRDEGIVKKIVFSTWIGEIDRYPGLKEFLSQKEVILVLSGEPKLIVSGHRFHQMKAFFYGLQVFQDDDLVLKTRVDLAGFDETMKDYFSGKLSLTRKKDSLFSVLSERVVVDYAQFMYPFLIGDAQFFGRKKDIQQFVNMDYFYDVAFKFMAVEQTFFSHPFIKKFPILATHYFWNLPHIIQAKDQYDQQKKDLLNSDHFFDVLTTYHQLLNDNFIVGWVPKEHGEQNFMESVYGPEMEIDIAKIFDRESPPFGINIGHEGSLHAYSNILFERLVGGHLKESDISKKYLAALKRTNDPAFQSSFTMNPAQISKKVSGFYNALEKKHPIPGYENKVFNADASINQENYIRAQEPICYVASEENLTLIHQYQTDITQLRRQNHELGLELKEYKYGSYNPNGSVAHKIIKKMIPEPVRKKLRETMPNVTNIYKKLVKRGV